MTKGMVFDIQHFCVDDGPGIRTTVFMKGCPLRCIWCHNPEGIRRQQQVSYDDEQCVRCGRCAAACTHGAHRIENGEHTLDRKLCIRCGQCIEKCPVDALRMYGRLMSVEEVLDDVIKDKPFYDNSDGGITLSGGEPLSQSEFALELLKAAKEKGMHTCIETSGYCSKEVMEEAARYTDLFLFDIKETDQEKHKDFTGVDNEQIMLNLRLLSELGKSVILRCPIIPGCNDREEHFRNIAELANELKSVQEIHLEPYHPFGLDKYEKMGMEAGYKNGKFMETETAAQYVEYIKRFTNTYVKIS